VVQLSTPQLIFIDFYRRRFEKNVRLARSQTEFVKKTFPNRIWERGNITQGSTSYNLLLNFKVLLNFIEF
jgi:hypothetical protein